MAAFVGYITQSNFIFPWPQHLDGSTGPSIDLSPEQQWDAIPEAAKWQIFTLIAFLEIWDECSNLQGMPHYTKGRMPGKYPSLQPFRDNVHFALDLFDPFGFSKNRSEEKKARGRLAEVNNGEYLYLGVLGYTMYPLADMILNTRTSFFDVNTGRLAMLGIFGFLSADKVEGSVPLLKDIAIPYEGNCMVPFEGNFHL